MAEQPRLTDGELVLALVADRQRAHQVGRFLAASGPLVRLFRFGVEALDRGGVRVWADWRSDAPSAWPMPGWCLRRQAAGGGGLT